MVIESLPFADYVAIEAEHASALKDALVSPLLYQHRKTSPREDSDTLRLGRAGHTALLEPALFAEQYTVFEGRRAGRAWDEFVDAHPGEVILTSKQADAALRVRDAVLTHPVAGKLFAQPKRTELTITWDDEVTGLSCKGRIDMLCAALCDLKLTRDPDPRRFSAAAGQYGYAMQLAFYADGAERCGLGTPPIKIIAAQSVEPYDVVVYDLDLDVLEHGRAQYRLALDTVAECRRTGVWPGLAWGGAETLRLPAWASPEADDQPLTMDGISLF